MRRGVRLKYLNPSGRWPSGNVRFYYRPPGAKAVPMPDTPPDHPLFLARYAELHGETTQPTPTTGTLAATFLAYQASDTFLALSAGTRANRRRALSKMADAYGAARLADLLPRHIRKDLSCLAPHPARNRLKVWRGLCRWAVDAGLIDTDPAREVRAPTPPQSDGFTAWTRDDFTQFRAHWPIGTPERLAFEIMHHTCAAIGDAIRLGPRNVADGWISYTRAKSRSPATCPLAGGPAWSEPDGQLVAALDAIEARHLTWLVKKDGAPRSKKSAPQWFSRACTAAGLPDLTAHGIRKGRAAIFRENGASVEQRMAWLGQETEGIARHYSRTADLRRVIEPGTDFSNSTEPTSNFPRKNA